MELASSAPEKDFNDHQEADSDVEDDDQFFVDEDFSSPDDDAMQFNNPMYAYQFNLVGSNDEKIPPSPPPQQQQPQQPEQQQQANDEEEEETDFLEMDFEPENSENENDWGSNGSGSFGFNQSLPSHFNLNCHNQQQQSQLQPNNNLQDDFPALHHHRIADENHYKNTGARPKILKQPPADSRCQKSIKQKQIMEGDQVFKITGHFSSTDEDQSLGCSSSKNYRNEYPSFRNGHTSSFNNKLHKSPVRSCHNSHKREDERNFEREQNNKFLFEIEPIKMRNSATVYTTNCDEKILLDALVSI
jgi:hypothetical protein